MIPGLAPGEHYLSGSLLSPSDDLRPCVGRQLAEFSMSTMTCG